MCVARVRSYMNRTKLIAIVAIVAMVTIALRRRRRSAGEPPDEDVA